jgi:ribosomal protein RSM22 (predicted rRNA methylase)
MHTENIYNVGARANQGKVARHEPPRLQLPERPQDSLKIKINSYLSLVHNTIILKEKAKNTSWHSVCSQFYNIGKTKQKNHYFLLVVGPCPNQPNPVLVLIVF